MLLLPVAEALSLTQTSLAVWLIGCGATDGSDFHVWSVKAPRAIFQPRLHYGLGDFIIQDVRDSPEHDLVPH